jgi:hypothetical protein
MEFKEIKEETLEERRRKRVKETAECFTPPELVAEMLDKLPPEVWTDLTKTFCDPAAGNGNFLVEVLRRKLLQGHPPLQALSTIYGVELMDDNTEEMKERLLGVLGMLDYSIWEKAKEILNHNIVCHDALTWDFENWKSTIVKSKALF